jgi:hypothetical protein
MGEGIDEHQTVEVVGIGLRIQAREEAAERMRGQDEGSRLTARVERRVQVVDHVRSAARHRHGCGPLGDRRRIAEQQQGARTVIGTHPVPIG